MMPSSLIPATALAFILTAAVPAFAAAPKDAAAGACSDELSKLDREIGDSRLGASNRDLRTLHQAAMIFARNGQAEACETVADGIRRYLRSDGTARVGATADFRQRLEAARPLAEMQGTIRMSDLIGADVVSTTGEKLGDVDDVVMSPGGDTRYLLVGTGGFLELGEKYVPVRTDEVRVIDRDTLVLDVQETAFKTAPRFDMDTIESKTQQWSNDIADWWRANVTDRVK